MHKEIFASAPKDKIGAGSSPINAYAIFNKLEEFKADLRCETKLLDVTTECSIIESNGKEEKLKSDSVILSFGTKVNTEAINKLNAVVSECYIIGDCNGNQGLWNATTSAYDVAMII